MKIGELRQRITFKIKSDKTTNDNAFLLPDDEIWKEDFKTVWSAVYPLKGKEFWSARAVHNEKTVKFYIRYTKGLKEDMMIVYGDRKFNITSIIDIDERHRWMQIIATEVIKVE